MAIFWQKENMKRDYEEVESRLEKGLKVVG